ncbi:MAG: hypothetical protein ACK42L_00035 [Thermoanaerobaculum sp.]
MYQGQKTLGFVRHKVAAALFAVFVGTGPGIAVEEPTSIQLVAPQFISLAGKEACGCGAAAGVLAEAHDGAGTPILPSKVFMRERVFTKILDGSSCGGFAGGTCFADDNSICYLEITCTDDGCIMDCA